MNRNISIVVVLLVLVVIAGYLIWLRSKFQPVTTPRVTEQVQVTPTATPVVVPTASPSAVPVTKEATGSVKQKTATPAATRK